jgi:hypothetical protein
MAKKNLLSASQANDRLAELEALRKIIAEAITSAKDSGAWRDISPLAGKLIDIGREVEELRQAKAKAKAAKVPDERFDSASV